MIAPMTPDEVRRYGEAVVHGCLGFRRGDTVMVLASYGHRDLAVAVAEVAYRGGAMAVDVVYHDQRVYAAKIEHASNGSLDHLTPWRRAQLRAIGDERVAIVQTAGEFELDVVAHLPAERVAAEAAPRARLMSPVLREGRLRGTICAWPTEEWAVRVFPELEAAKATRRLGRELLSFCRLGPDDPPGHKGWTQHLTQLRRRAARLTKLDLKEVHVVDDGTDLRVRIAPFSLWRGGDEQDKWGRRVTLNAPTEECYVSPDARGTEGVFRCSRPRSIGGRMIEGLSGEFRGGKLVRLDAASSSDRDWLAQYIAATPGADRIGEIALVDATSRIGKTGRIYFNTLLDENAGAHFAFGSGFAKTRSVALGRKRYGVNRSRTHIDVVYGTPALNAWGVTQAGRRVALVRDAAWQF